MYGVLTLVMLWERGKNPMKPMISVWQLLLIPIVMGGLIELAQRYLTTCRSGEWLDFVGDTIGVVIGAILYVAFHAAKDHSPRM